MAIRPGRASPRRWRRFLPPTGRARMPVTTPRGRGRWPSLSLRLRDLRSHSCYGLRMSDIAEKKLSKAEIAELRQLRLEAMNLQAIEGNPLDADDIAMFEMFEREGWSDEKCRAYILARKPTTN